MTRLYSEWQSHSERQYECSHLMSKFDLYAARLFHDYEPLTTPTEEVPKDFLARLDKWLRNFKDDADQWNAFRLVEDIFFVGRHELNELYRIAFESVASDWIIECSQLKYDDANFAEKLEQARGRAWFCPITDSLRINAFRHINHVSSPDYFPDWRSLEKFGEPEKIKKYIKENIDFLILIEDFVGTGKQIENTIEFVKKYVDIPVLILPLIICSTGDRKLAKFEDAAAGNYYRPVLRLPIECLLTEDAEVGDSESTQRNRAVVEKYRGLTHDKKPYGFEVGGGSLVVMHSNCPNNTIMPIHAHTQKWMPLFPRSKRKAVQ